MSSQFTQQYAFRAQKSVGLIDGSPNYEPVPGFQTPETTARVYQYSPDGRLWALALPTGVQIYRAEGAQLLLELPVPNVVELGFSPRGTYLSTWERPVKVEDGSQHKNLRIFSVSTGEELVAFTQKSQNDWDLQYTISESHAIRLVSQEVQVFRPSEWSKGIIDKLKVENATSVSVSPGLNPSVAIFIGEKKGAPASVKIYGLLTLGGPPTCQKTFYKADRAQIKWNMLGTQVLVLTHTDVDKTNKSYYGETGLYLLSAAGNFDCRVTLDKDGPIHDFAWSPNSKEFAVVYGYMPAKAMLFDQRVRTLHDFGSGPHNFIAFNPQGRLIILAGFGNLAGKMSIFDRKILGQVASIDAPNTSWCEWSPDGRFILTATLSPRLRVDNGIKIWHCSGPLMHVQMIEELYQASSRPTPIDSVPTFPQVVPPAPAPGPSVASLASVEKPTPTKPLGAYRPPGARGLATPAIYKREDEGGLPSSGQSTPSRGYSRSPAPGAHDQRNGRRHVPGAAHSPSPGPDSDKKASNKKRKGAKGGKKEDGAATLPVNGSEERVEPPSIDLQVNGVSVDETSVPPTPGADGSLDPAAKKIRNLNKKLKAIDELKEKQGRGERLEATQLKKIESEAEIRKELSSLGAPGS
ncbi:translation initiation factor eIF-2A [Neolentinus lepideus HHB14362 ss-1]|uniref:Eukaryotic translation initiation factor 2A n=1 Tax=Neolentinus lepideus HHB14362 ss-1 TaxID=1314782 RepID=A0A165MXE3_9AGAM|nr:translation initiation factor eIF-2A [Neolentinus lepideus HHB14362 ss-1]